MKYLMLYGFLAFFFMSCGGSKRTAKNDSLEKEQITFTAKPKSFAKELAGKWKVISMRRQQKAQLEVLNNVALEFDVKDNRFYGKAPCNNINGSFALNGYSIRFSNIASTKMACDNLDQEGYYLKLLEERISAFTIDKDKLYLRDGISNIVFECDRVK